MSRPPPTTGRVAWSSIALALTLLTVILLGLGAVLSARYSRRTAEGVLADYARMAADRLAETAEIRIAQRFYPVLVTLRSRIADRAGPDPSAIRWPADGPGQGSFLVPPNGRLLSDRDLGPALGSRLESGFSSGAELPEAAYLGLLLPDTREGPVVVFAELTDSAGGGLRGVYGVLLPFDSLTSALGAAAAAPGMLPRTLAARVAPDSVLGAGFGSGRLGLLIERRLNHASRYRVAVPLRPQYGGLEALATLREDTAPLLLRGGLPARAPWFMSALLLVSLLLLVGAWTVMRRERATARVREAFIAGVSHELRTPLAQIRLFVETLRLGRTRNRAELERALEVIDEESSRLGHLVDNLLQFAGHGSARPALRACATDLSALLARIAQEFEPLARATAATVACRIDPGVTATVDPDAVRQVVLNLLDNAVKYGPEGQRVVLGLSAEPAGARVWVEDQGPGIPARERGRVWDRFWRGAVARERGVGGAGIGLWVVRELAVAHGGSVEVQAVDGGGARVIVVLPLEAAGA